MTNCKWCRHQPAKVLVKAIVGVGPSKFWLCYRCLTMLRARQQDRQESGPEIIHAI